MFNDATKKSKEKSNNARPAAIWLASSENDKPGYLRRMSEVLVYIGKEYALFVA